jgi:hypothetical protein
MPTTKKSWSLCYKNIKMVFHYHRDSMNEDIRSHFIEEVSTAKFQSHRTILAQNFPQTTVKNERPISTT